MIGLDVIVSRISPNFPEFPQISPNFPEFPDPGDPGDPERQVEIRGEARVRQTIWAGEAKRSGR